MGGRSLFICASKGRMGGRSLLDHVLVRGGWEGGA